MENNRLIIPEYPLLISPGLANKLGLKEAIFLQQLHLYFTQKCHIIFNSKNWVCISCLEWQSQLPFWSLATIKRIIMKLKKRGIIDICNLTNLYLINYDKIYLE